MLFLYLLVNPFFLKSLDNHIPFFITKIIIAQCATQHATLITVEKWGDYQSAGEKATQLAAQQRTSREHLDSISTAPIEEYKEREEKEEDRVSIERDPLQACHLAWLQATGGQQ